MTDTQPPDIDGLLARIEALEAEVQLIKPRTWGLKDGVKFGSRVRIHQSCRIIATNGRTVRIGDGVLVRRGAEIVGPVTIGDGCFFNRDAYIRSNVHFGKNCNVGAFARFITDTHELSGPSRRAGEGSFPPIHVGDGTWVGAGVTVLGGVSIGVGCVIAAGSVVARDVPDHMMAGGVPARVIKELPA